MATVRLHHPTKESPPAWSMTSRQTDRVREVSPGPAYYYDDQLESPNGGARFDRTPKLWATDGLKTPGPGYYDEIHALTKTQSSSHTMLGKKPHKWTAPVTTPGPGAYEQLPLATFNNTGTKYTIADPPDEGWIGEPTPGPGEYKTPKPRKKGFGRPIFGRQLRLFGYRKNVPGPGSYDTPEGKCSGPVYSITKVKKPMHRRAKTQPGPGHYDSKIQKSPNGPKFVEFKPYEPIPDQKPGPGQHNPKLTHRVSSPAFSIGDGMRPLEFKHTFNKPGPGTYEFILKPTRPSTTFSKSAARAPLNDRKKKVPGPCVYKYKPRAKTGVGFPESPRQLHSPRDTPGPGTYEQIPKVSIGVVISPRQKPAKQRAITPGPGQYDEEPAVPRTYSFCRDAREKACQAKPDQIINVPASTPIAPKYLIPEIILQAYDTDSFKT